MIVRSISIWRDCSDLGQPFLDNAHVPYKSTVFLIISYGALLAQRSSLFGTAQFSLWASGPVNYDYIVTNSINLC